MPDLDLEPPYPLALVYSDLEIAQCVEHCPNPPEQNRAAQLTADEYPTLSQEPPAEDHPARSGEMPAAEPPATDQKPTRLLDVLREQLENACAEHVEVFRARDDQWPDFKRSDRTIAVLDRSLRPTLSVLSMIENGNRATRRRALNTQRTAFDPDCRSLLSHAQVPLPWGGGISLPVGLGRGQPAKTARDIAAFAITHALWDLDFAPSGRRRSEVHAFMTHAVLSAYRLAGKWCIDVDPATSVPYYNGVLQNGWQHLVAAFRAPIPSFAPADLAHAGMATREFRIVGIEAPIHVLVAFFRKKCGTLWTVAPSIVDLQSPADGERFGHWLAGRGLHLGNVKLLESTDDPVFQGLRSVLPSAVAAPTGELQTLATKALDAATGWARRKRSGVFTNSDELRDQIRNMVRCVLFGAARRDASRRRSAPITRELNSSSPETAPDAPPDTPDAGRSARRSSAPRRARGASDPLR